jgi:hypothetical protein
MPAPPGARTRIPQTTRQLGYTEGGKMAQLLLRPTNYELRTFAFELPSKSLVYPELADSINKNIIGRAQHNCMARHAQ